MLAAAPAAGPPNPQGAAPPPGDPLLAIRLFALAPLELAGLVIRGGGPLRDLLLDRLQALLPASGWRRLPAHVDDEGLLGGVDLAASLVAGRRVRQSGLIAQSAGGLLCVPMAERLREAVSGRLAQAMDHASGPDRFALVLLDDGAQDDERPPAALTERCGLLLDLTMAEPKALAALAEAAASGPQLGMAREIFPAIVAAPEDLDALAQLGEWLGIASLRPLRLALIAARAHAALAGRTALASEDLAAATRLVLAPRATRLPPAPAEDPPPPEAQSKPPPQPPGNADNPDNLDNLDNANNPRHPDHGEEQNRQPTEAELEEVILEAVRAAIPPDILARIAQGQARRSPGGGSSGRKTPSRQRGRPLGALPGDPRQGARLALIDTLRTAAPWQKARRAMAAQHGRTVVGIEVHKDDLRIRRFEDQTSSLTIFAVDASGSAALARLAEAKGAVERILAQAYAKRTEVALLAFRGTRAEVLLPATRSLTRARRALATLPGGGGTPLAAGLLLARQLAQAASARGQTPFLVFLTDGSANIALDGTPGRRQAREDGHQMARALGASGLASVVIDISARPRREAAELAAALGGRYLPLPLGNSATLQQAVSSAQAQAEKAAAR